MDFCFEKIEAAAAKWSYILDIYSIGKEVHDSLDCKENR